MLTIDLQWGTLATEMKDYAGFQVGYDVGEMSVPLTAFAYPPVEINGPFREPPNITLQIDLNSRQLHRFWVMAYDAAGNMGKKVYLKNAYQA